MFKFGKLDSAGDVRHFYRLGVLVVITTVILFIALVYGMPLPEAGSAQAGVIDTMIWWHLLLIALLFALVVVPMIYAYIVFRKREGDEEEGEHFEGNTTLEIAWTVIPLILVVIFAFYGIWGLNEITKSYPDEMGIKVTGQQWAWSFEYAGGVISDTLTLPVNKPIRMDMTSKDVLHAFWVREFRVKQDVVPGQTTELRFTPTLEGEFDLVCAELCGLTHYNMKSKVRVVSEAEFTAWLDTEVAKVDSAIASR